MFALSWDIEELKRLNGEGRSLRTEVLAAIDICSPDAIEQHNLPRKLTSIRKRLSEFIKKVTRFHRKPATHVFVFMISSVLRNQKPYALPVQCIPYAGLKETDIRRLVSALVKEMVSHGMNVAGKHFYSIPLCSEMTNLFYRFCQQWWIQLLEDKGVHTPTVCVADPN